MKKAFKFLSMVFIIALLLCLVPTVAMAANPSENITEFLGGTGEVNNPYIISNKTHLSNAHKYPNAHFKLMSDIVLNDSDYVSGGLFYNGGKGWTPIGTQSSPFSGSFDGNNHSITGIKININETVTSSQIYGIFGYSSADISNLSVSGEYTIKISGGTVSSDGKYNAHVGGLVGINNGGKIEGCTVDININYSSYIYGEVWVGGLVGQSIGGSFIQSSNTGDIVALSYPTNSTQKPHGKIYAGGLAGSISNATVSKSYNTGIIDATGKGIGCDHTYGSSLGHSYNIYSNGYGTAYVGGLFGYAGSTSIDIGYNTGALTATAESKCSTINATSSYSYAYVGGCVGYSDNCTVRNYYNTGELKAVTAHTETGMGTQKEYIYLGGICGYASSSSISQVYNIADYSYASTEERGLDSLYVYVSGITGNKIGGNAAYYVNTYDSTEAGKIYISDFMYADKLSGFDFTNVWSLDVTSTYMLPTLKGMPFEGVFQVEITGIEMYTLPTKTLYKKGVEEIDLSGVKIQVIRLGEYKCEIIDVTSDMISGWNINVAGNQTITVTYEGFSTTFTVEVRDDNTTQFAGGLGTEKWPYIITSASHMNNVRSYPSAYFRMDADVDMSQTAWYPIGTFSGCFDGNGHIIRNLKITSGASFDSSEYGAALIAYNTGTVIKLGVTGKINISATKTIYLGGIAAYNKGVINQCFSDIKIDANTTSYAQNSYSSSRSSSCYAGGIAGYSTTKIGNCYFTGAINVKTYSASAGPITICGNAYASGIANGYYYVESCYSIGTVNATAGSGNVDMSSKANAYIYAISSSNSNCYSEIDDTMIFSKCYDGFDFVNVWGFDPFTEYKYPQLLCHLKEVESIAVVSKPTDPIEMVEGLYPDLSQIIVRVNYEDGTSKSGSLSPSIIEHLSSDTIGSHTISVRMQNVESSEKLTFNIVPKEPVSLEIEQLPTKLIYVQGQPLNLSDGIFKLNYSNNTKEYISPDDLTVSYDKDKVGNVVVSISYLGFTTQFTITTNERIISNVELVEPSNLVYEQYRDLNLVDGHLVVTFVSDDNYYEIIKLSDLTVQGFNKNMLGYQTLTVSHKSYQHSFIVRVVECSNHEYSEWVITPEAHTRTCGYCNAIDTSKHIFDEQGICTSCNNARQYVIGDFDGEEGITANDAIYLLYNVFFGDEMYPVDQPCDFDGDSSVTANDAIYLLYHVFFGDESYPLA